MGGMNGGKRRAIARSRSLEKRQGRRIETQRLARVAQHALELKVMARLQRPQQQQKHQPAAKPEKERGLTHNPFAGLKLTKKT